MSIQIVFVERAVMWLAAGARVYVLYVSFGEPLFQVKLHVRERVLDVPVCVSQRNIKCGRMHSHTCIRRMSMHE